MYSYKDITYAQLDIITTLSSSEKATVSLVSMKDSAQMAILKEYTGRDMQEFYNHIQQLQSPYLPEIYHIWQEQGHTCLLEEYIGGRTLRELLDEKEQLQQSQLQTYMEELCRAVATLHRALPPIIHRDIKPENIIITKDGSLKLLDLDAAREYKESGERDTILLGTREYASPEQFGFSQTDVRSDIYSLGVVFAELLEHASVAKAYRTKADRIVSRATMFDPEKRYDRVDGLLKDLEMLARCFHHSSKKRWGRRYGFALVLGILLLAGGIFACVGTGLLQQDYKADAVSEQIPELAEPGAAGGCISFPESTPREPEDEEIILGPEDGEVIVGPGDEEMTIAPVVMALEEVYNYRSTGEEVRSKIGTLMEGRPEFYNIREDPYEDAGFYAPFQECIIGRDYITVHFLQSHPRDLLFRDQRLDDYVLKGVYLIPYEEETGRNGEAILLDTSHYQLRCGNIISVSKDYLLTLAPGAYTLEMELGSYLENSRHAVYLVVHGEEEEVENCRLNLYGDIAYYSSETRNDVFFYVLNTPYPIERIEIDGVPAQEGDYQLVEDGYGVVFSSEFLKQHEAQEAMELTFVAENGKYTGGRIIFLQHFQ